MVNVPAIEPIDHFGTSFPQHNDMALSPVYAAQKLDKTLTPSSKKQDSSLVVVPQSPPPKFTEEVVVPSGHPKDEAIVPEFKAPRNQVPTYRQQSASAEFQLAPPALAVPDLDFLDNADWTSPFDLDLDFGSVFDSWDESHLVFGPPAHQQQQQAPAAAMAPVLVERRTVEQASTTSSESEEVDEFTRNRRACLERYREKKRNRRFSKKVRYHLRKMNADRRPRYKGRFIKKGEVIPQELLDKPKSQQ